MSTSRKSTPTNNPHTLNQSSAPAGWLGKWHFGDVITAARWCGGCGYDDHIMLWNEGVLPEDYTVETLMNKHISKARNPKIAYVFFLAGFIEAWGRGYEKIMREFDKSNLKHPIFKEEHGGVSAIIPREIFMAIRSGMQPRQTEPKPNQNRTKTEQKNLIVELIRCNPKISRAELSVQLGLHESSVQRRLDALVKEGKLLHIGPTNGGYWEITDS